MRGRALLLAGVAALLPVASGGAWAEAPAQSAAARFTPPTTPLVLTRSVIRVLADGKQIVVTRRYVIRFVPEGDGYRLEGEQIDARVEAPPILASLAEIERKRIEKGLFPARLDAHGMIREGAQALPDPAVRQAAAAQGARIIGGAPIALEAKRERSALLNQVSSIPATSAWPAFLFNPGHEERVERRRVALPGGDEGEVEVRIRASELMPCGLPGRVERVVTTQLAGTSRVSREVWTIAAATP